jgi:hypothetical protein
MNACAMNIVFHDPNGCMIMGIGHAAGFIAVPDEASSGTYWPGSSPPCSSLALMCLCDSTSPLGATWMTDPEPCSHLARSECCRILPKGSKPTKDVSTVFAYGEVDTS